MTKAYLLLAIAMLCMFAGLPMLLVGMHMVVAFNLPFPLFGVPTVCLVFLACYCMHQAEQHL